MPWNCRLLTLVAVLIVACFGSAMGSVASSVATFSYNRLVAFGDLHGDLENAKELLMLAQLVDSDGNWNGGRATAIQVGDVVDRGYHPHEIIEYFEQLRVQAAKAGGEFIQLLGNHEVMNLKGDATFAAKPVVEAFGGFDNWREAFSPSGRYGKTLSRLDAAAIRNRTLFVHAGLMPKFADRPIVELNAGVRTAIRMKQFAHPLLMNDGPVWTRDPIHAAQRGHCDLVSNAISALSDQEIRHGGTAVDRIVVGHTIQPNGVVMSYCNGTLLAIDIAISQYMQGGGHLGFVEFRPDAKKSGNVLPVVFYPPQAAKRHAITMPKKPDFSASQQWRWIATHTNADTAILAVVALAILLWKVRHSARSNRRRRRTSDKPL